MEAITEKTFEYVCNMCGLKIDTSECNFEYSPGQITIYMHCPVCRDGTLMTPVYRGKNKNELPGTVASARHFPKTGDRLFFVNEEVKVLEGYPVFHLVKVKSIGTGSEFWADKDSLTKIPDSMKLAINKLSITL